MFDLSWGEVLIVGAVALIVIGPKDLPKALRTVGQVAGKMRRMASEFQGQFNEAMREAELDEIRKQVASVNDAASFNPIDTIRSELKSSIEAKPEAKSEAKSQSGDPTPSADAAASTSPQVAGPADPLAALAPPEVAPVGDPAAAFAPAPSPAPAEVTASPAATTPTSESAKA